jgi:hypothetical protein
MVDKDDLSFWEYFAEGRHHLLLFYTGANPLYLHSLLRIEKLLPSLEFSNNPLSSLQWNSSQYFQLISLFLSSKYLFTSQDILISPDFLRKISTKIHSSRPLRRRSQSVNLSQPYASLIPNLTLIHKPLPLLPLSSSSLSSTPFPCLTIEFKIKSGLLSLSPFLPPTHLKRSLTKFQYMQYVKYSNQVSPPSPSSLPLSHSLVDSFHISQYNPSDLCSQNRQRILSSLETLEGNPQNNFLVSFDGRPIFGSNQANPMDLEASLNSFFLQTLGWEQRLGEQHPPQQRELWRDQLKDIISLILSTEDALVQLQCLQSVDLLDAEGMILVFHRMLHLLSRGTLETDRSQLQKYALEIIAQAHSSSSATAGGEGTGASMFPIEICDFIASHRRDLNESLLTPSSSSSKETQNEIWIRHHQVFLSAVSQLDHPSSSQNHVLIRLYLLSLQVGVLCSSSSPLSASNLTEVEAQRETFCSEFLSGLDLDDCELLLRLWLLSLAACDASAILTLGGISPLSQQEDENEDSEKKRKREEDKRVMIAQSDQCAGICSCTCWREEHKRDISVLLSYHLFLVDLGPKPVDKILEKLRSNSRTDFDAENGWKHLHELGSQSRELDGGPRIQS